MYLPDLILIEIFSNFNFEQLFNLRIVCKRWKLLIEYLAKNQTRIYVSKYYNPKLKINNQRIKYEDVIDQPFFENICLAKNYFTNIKKLILPNTNLTNLKSERIGSKIKYILENLEELHISSHDSLFGQSMMSDDDLFDKVLNFKNLKFLKLKILSLIDFNFKKELTLNAPILENLCFNSPSHHTISIPILKGYDAIKILECNNRNIYKRKLLNLEHLICRYIDLNFNLLNYPKLKRLDLFPAIGEIGIIENLFKQKNQNRNFNDLEILIFGLPISIVDANARNLCSIFKKNINFFNIEGCLEPIKKNYLNLKTDHHPWIYCLNFEDSIFDTYQYFSKIDIYQIFAEELKDTKILINFIIKIGGVRSLDLRRCKIEKKTKEYFEKVPFLFSLSLSDCEIERTCDFICNIKKLIHFYLRTNYHPIQDFIDNSLKGSIEETTLDHVNLIDITFYWKENKIMISSFNDKTFGETIKSADSKLDDILPVLLNFSANNYSNN